MNLGIIAGGAMVANEDDGNVIGYSEGATVLLAATTTEIIADKAEQFIGNTALTGNTIQVDFTIDDATNSLGLRSGVAVGLATHRKWASGVLLNNSALSGANRLYIESEYDGYPTNPTTTNLGIIITRATDTYGTVLRSVGTNNFKDDLGGGFGAWGDIVSVQFNRITGQVVVLLNGSAVSTETMPNFDSAEALAASWYPTVHFHRTAGADLTGVDVSVLARIPPGQVDGLLIDQAGFYIRYVEPA